MEKVADLFDNAVRLSEHAMAEPAGPSRDRAMNRLHSYLSGLRDAYIIINQGFEDLAEQAADDDDD